MQFNRIRLNGFKSFVEPTELLIQRGMTGIVGPNGCGKSNLVEALRWAMGETSAKRIRGTGMEDVIFAGSGSRSARNIAEVAIVVDNQDRDAPAAYNSDPEIEVIRRIERDGGSRYTINGCDVRARDVQRLFADAASGAQSSALVSQGEIGALIKAKPEDRRLLIEEAAGITGLHSRRHEAELRLRAAATNLERLDDVMATLESQLQGLKRQARQATRYRNLSGYIRKAEANLLFVTWMRGIAALDAARGELDKHVRAVADAAEAAARTTTKLEKADAALPPLREIEAEAAARVHRLDVAGEQLDEEERRTTYERNQLEARQSQIVADTERERVRLDDAVTSVGRLNDEFQTIKESRGNEEEALSQATKSLHQSHRQVATLEAELAGLNTQLAENDAERRNLGQTLTDLTQELVRLNERRIKARQEWDRIVSQPTQATDATTEDLAPLQQVVQAARESHAKANETLELCRSAEAEARDAFRKVEAEVSRIGAEEAALASLLGDQEGDLWPRLIDAVTVESGYEAALAAALGDELNVAADPAAPVHWRDVGARNAPPLPDGVPAITDFVEAPDLLTWRLSQIGVVENEDAGPGLQAGLRQGQRLVSRRGTLWRWDGYTVTADAPTMALTRLNQRNRLRELRDDLERLRPSFEQARQATLDEKTSADEAVTIESEARQKLRKAEDELHAERESIAESQRKTAERLSVLQTTAALLAEIAGGEAAFKRRRRDTEATLRELAPISELRAGTYTQHAKLVDARDTRDELQAEFTRLEHVSESRSARLTAIKAEQETWQKRKDQALSQVTELQARQRETEASYAQITQRPSEISTRRKKLLVEIEAAERTRREASDQLANAEAVKTKCAEQCKGSTATLADKREEKIRREGSVAQLEERDREVRRRIAEALNCAPEEARAIAELKDGAELPDIDATDNRLQRLLRERENMGPVNLRAEQEAAEIGEQLQTLLDERADLDTAIARLRQGISSLNREGRERLLAAFSRVDKNFRELFSIMFGGGRAHLSLTDADDPLEAGVEIMASPPGKRLQILSLLSGGEQALTAIALLVAVFQTNPAPICVLDEVDAPLDETNVQRFCDLIDTIAKQTDTRFLVVTHNPVTMARVDRLYGVTMAESGVSQLVSVNLMDAEAMRATA